MRLHALTRRSRPQVFAKSASAIGLTLALLLVTIFLAQFEGQASIDSEPVVVTSRGLTLRAQIWRPSGRGPFPAVAFNHGSYSTDDPMPLSEPEILGPVFARHGYVFLLLFRQGIGLSSGQGVSDGDQMARALKAEGQEGRDRVQLHLLENEELDAAFAALSHLRARPEVDARRIAVVGHSFGGSLSLLMAARDPIIRAAVIFGGAAGSWAQSAALRERLLQAVQHVSAPIFFIHAENDYSTAPGETLAAQMRQIGKAHLLRIYPAVGPTPRDGHNLLYRTVSTWESDVFAFLDAHVHR